MDKAEKYMSTKQAAEFIGVHVKTLRRYVKDCSIPYTKPKGRYYFAKSQLVAFINNEL